MHEGRLEQTPIPRCEVCKEETKAVGGAVEGKRRYQCTNYQCTNRKYYTRPRARRAEDESNSR